MVVKVIANPFCSGLHAKLPSSGLETKILEHSPSGRVTFKLHLLRSVFTCPVILQPWTANLPLQQKFPCYFVFSYSRGGAVLLSD